MGLSAKPLPFQSPNLLKEHRVKHKIESKSKPNTDSRLVEPNYEEIKVQTQNSTVELGMTDSEDRKGEIEIATDPDTELNMPSAIQYQNQTAMNISTQKFISQLGLPVDGGTFNIQVN